MTIAATIRQDIETPSEGVYDITGWDLRKVLRLAARGDFTRFFELINSVAVSQPVLGAWMDGTIAMRHGRKPDAEPPPETTRLDTLFHFALGA